MGSEWKEYELKDILTISYGKSLTKKDRIPGNYNVYGSGGVIGTNKNYLVEGPGIIIGRKGTVGSVYYEKGNFYPIDTTYYIEKSEKYDIKFIYYMLRQARLDKMNSHSAVPGLNREDLYRLKFRIPEKPEQQKIASILSAFDDKIELNNEMNKTLEEIAQAIFKHWFIDFEFPNENGEPYKSSGGEFVDSELGPIPKGWKVVNLREILDNICDSVKPGKEIEGLPYVPIDIIERKSIALKQFKSWEEAQSSLIKFKKDDILLGAMRVYFHKVSIAPCEGITRKTCFVLRPKKRFDLSYTLLLIFQDDTIKFADAHSKGTTMPYAVWDNGLAEMKIALPTEKIRQRFNELLYPIISKIRDCIFENLTLSQLRDTLLPKLISGEIRVM